MNDTEIGSVGCSGTSSTVLYILDASSLLHLIILVLSAVLCYTFWGRQPPTIAAGKEVVHMANKKQTSKSVATKASKALRDGRTSKNTKSIAGSALSQAKKP